MQRITTATRAVDLYGPGKDGFEDTPPAATQLEGAWFNAVQEEIARAVEDQEYVLDGLNLGQLTIALNNWQWSGSPSIKSGASLTVLTGGTFTCDANSTFSVNSSTPTFGATSEVSMLGDVIIGTDSGNILTVYSLATFVEILTPAAGIDLAAQSITGIAGSLVDVDVVTALDLELDDALMVLPASARRIRYNSTTLTIHESDAVIRTIDVTDRGYQDLFTTPGAIDTTAASCNRRLQQTEPVWLRMTFGYQHTTGALGTLSTRIQVAGPITIDIAIRAWELKAAAGVRWQPFSWIFRWIPTDDFVLPGTTNYIFTARVGSSLGVNLELRDIGIEVVSDINV